MHLIADPDRAFAPRSPGLRPHSGSPVAAADLEIVYGSFATRETTRHPFIAFVVRLLGDARRITAGTSARLRRP